MRAVLLEDARYSCPYLSGRETVMEQFLIREVTPLEHEALLFHGYRHFGAYYFRPRCGACHACIPVRIPVTDPRSRRSWRRVLNKASALSFSFLETPDAEEAFAVYRLHKQRFSDNEQNSLDVFRESFFTPHPAAGVLTVRSGTRLVGVAHFDDAGESLSAVYTYYDHLDFSWASPGKLAVLKLLEYARDCGRCRIYLGYYVYGNRSMAYKADFTPLEYSPRGGEWQEPDTSPEKLEFVPGPSLLGSS